MALSNWDCMAFDQDGSPCIGRLSSGNETMSIYKNWVWIDGVGNNPQQFEEGFRHVGNLCVMAIRHQSQDSVFCRIQHGSMLVAGIGCYGFDGMEWVGVTPETLGAFMEWLRSIDQELADKIKPGGLRYNQGDAFFAEHGMCSLPASAVGKAEKPLLLQDTKKPEVQ